MLGRSIRWTGGARRATPLSSTSLLVLIVTSYNEQSIQVSGANWRNDGVVPLSPKARQALKNYFGWCVEKVFDTSSDVPLFRSLSRNGYGNCL